MKLNVKYRVVLITLIVFQLLMVIMYRQEILEGNYGWNGKTNMTILIGYLLIQVLLIYLISRVKEEVKQNWLFFFQIMIVSMLMFGVLYKIDMANGGVYLFDFG